HPTRGPFFHASASQRPGHRVTWLKLATPRVEALRQAFLAADSRLRLAYQRRPDGALAPLDHAPDATTAQRPWLRSITISGGASFFGGIEDEQPRSTCFELSPDLTCIIGSSMTGKSTLLDGLRLAINAPLPQDKALRAQIQARGRDLFLAGSPDVVLDCPNHQSSEPVDHDAWPALFFTQNELQRLVADEEALVDILGGLSTIEKPGIVSRRAMLAQHDTDLEALAKQLARLDDALEDAEQATERATAAQAELVTFSAPGLEQLTETRRARHRWQAAVEQAALLCQGAQTVATQAHALEAPELDAISLAALHATGIESDDLAQSAPGEQASVQLARSERDLQRWREQVRRIEAALAKQEAQLERDVERQLAARGLEAEALKRFRVLSAEAAHLAHEEAARDGLRAEVEGAEARFVALRFERRGIAGLQRRAYDRVIGEMGGLMAGKLSVRRVDGGHVAPLERFVRGLAKSSITRWWNQLDEAERARLARLVPVAGEEAESLQPDMSLLRALGMSESVQRAFSERMTRAKLRELGAVRCPDRYVLELQVGEGELRELSRLSGGQRLGVLLSLLLETKDARPLVLDQPEDELDTRFLVESVLPALKRLKGRRQVIIATHNANLVVNGDAERVIFLEATARRGRVAQAGAIEQPALREAIVQTVDGGEAAFALRREKYGF
ncbi:MAG: hypothetical protein JRH20_22700, partial [Deltaproteobacteria bacterium]|nr:hypothetical protein [Deltaproteobacteria bacterium]